MSSSATGVFPNVAFGQSAAMAATLLIASMLISTAAIAQAPSAEEALEEIVVTARKAEESVQDVPISIQVLDGELLDRANLTRLFELQFNVPGLVINNFGAGARFALRGVADEGGTGLSVATHLNGVYLGTANLAVARMFDFERVEVLKGPQGTLYGRNATGGSINFITRAPGDEFDAGVELGYGTFETIRGEGHVNMPFESGALRLAFTASDGDGYIKNTVDDRRFGEDDYWGVRASYRHDLTDDVQIELMAQHVEDTGGRGQVWVPRPDFLPDPSDIRRTTVTLTNPFQETKTDNINLTVEAQLPSATFRSITGYSQNEETENRDCAGQAILQGCVRQVKPADYEQWSQELQLLSRPGGALDWIVGAYYFDADQSTQFSLEIPAINPEPLNDSFTTSGETSYAIFGQGSWNITERLTGTVGLRFSFEERVVSEIGTGVSDSPVLVQNKDDWDDVSWRLDLEYQLDDEILVYGGISTGFKSGGITTNELPTGELDRFDSEELTAYEFGVKSQWLDRQMTLNGAAFFYDFTDLQVLTTIFTGDELIGQVDNAAKAEIYGIDAEMSYNASDRLAITAGLVWMPKREFVEFRNDATGDTLSGNKVSRAPEWSATTGINYEHELGAFGNLSWRLEYNYRSKFFFLKENDPVIAQDNLGFLNVFLRFEPEDSRWYLHASGRNLTDEDYFTQVGFQSSPGLPDTYEIGFGLQF